ncbi:MAG: NAD-dependent succinate-semialdehyde dehydrogenase [Candidatus Magasanikbacteria bacterium]
MPIVSHNPTTGKDIQSFEELSIDEINARIELSQSAFQHWRIVSFAERSEKMHTLATLLREKKYELGKLATLEMGKPITQAVGEIEKCAWACDYYADDAEHMLAPEHVSADYAESYIRFDPLGVILAIMPWNFPYWQVFRFVAPALMAGNVGLLKHASNVPQCARAIEHIIEETGFPKGVFQTLLVGSAKVEHIIAHDYVQAITLTGSEHAGSVSASQAAKLIKKSVLELGGSDPFIVLSDADIVRTCEFATAARLQNAGQSCIAAKRFIVVEDRYDEFIQNYREQFSRYIVGDPMDEKTQLGPVVSQASIEELKRQINESVLKGAEIVYGGKQLDRAGYFFEPTIVSHVTKGMPLYDEEAFGPVSAVIIVHDEEKAIQVANDTRFGLGASIWTKDIEKAQKLASHIEAGSVFINGMVKSDPRLPFGGIKKSGFGRELSHYGIKEFVNVKTVVVNK